MLQERWLLQKADLYNSEIISLQGCNFWTDGLAYDKLTLFKVNYEREPRIGFEIRKKGKHAKAEKKYIDRNKKEIVEYKVGDKVLLSTKDLTQQMRNKEIKKLIEKFVRPYKENYIRKCGGVVVTSIDENLPSSKCEQDSNVSEADRETKEDHTFSSRDRWRERI